MCGIVGIWDTRNKIDSGLLERMRDTMRHRGPDDEGIYIDETRNVGLGHRRLAILDPGPSGHQPMSFDGLWTVHNGEIYNFKDVRQRLVSFGHQFTTESDTEVFLKGYRQWGNEVVEHFHGMFATALWDERVGRLTIFRDRGGVKPLYYYQSAELFIFASELKAIIEHPSVVREIDFDALSLYLKLGYIPAPFSIFKNIFKLDPGHILTVDGPGRCEKSPYWNVFDCFSKEREETFSPPASEEEAADALERILTESFKLRMVSDVPVGVFLSGGVDSSTVAALLQANSSKPIRTFTIGFDEEAYDEAEQAREVAHHLGTEHHELYCTPKMALDIIPRLPEIYDEPFGDASGIPTYLVSKFAREHVKVALSADGGDEVFAGYLHHQNLDKTYRSFSRFAPTSQFALSLLGRFPLRQLAGLKVENVELKLKKLNEIARKGRSMSEFLFIGLSIWPEADVIQLLRHSASGFERFMRPYRKAEQQIDQFTDLMRAADYKSFLADDILVKVDRASMAVGLEGREPFLDQRIIEFAARLPRSLLIREGDAKYILKKILYRYVPESVVDRPKRGFAVPLDAWLKSDLKHLLLDHLSEDAIKREGVFDWEMVKRETEDFLSGRMTSYARLWLLLEFEMWRKKWLG